jgi:hypothetical protein
MEHGTTILLGLPGVAVDHVERDRCLEEACPRKAFTESIAEIPRAEERVMTSTTRATESRSSRSSTRPGNGSDLRHADDSSAWDINDGDTSWRKALWWRAALDCPRWTSFTT